MLHFVDKMFQQTGRFAGVTASFAQVLSDRQRDEEHERQVDGSARRQRVERAEGESLSPLAGPRAAVVDQFVAAFVFIENPIFKKQTDDM